MTTTSGRPDSTGTTPADDEVAEELLGFLAANTKTTWERDQDLFAVGGMSSLFAMQLVVHLEKTHGIVISGADLMLDNFRTVDAMVRLVGRLAAPGPTGEATGPAGG
ncbi:acyl carrier protein [Streptomyces spiramyceticus]|uniref:Acyl carrier protein n=1 Tax=Streptomyces spiramyceticus TaxID=299717 RepID=A0A411PXF1_9ACTN|nr:acyl carrier protein [Streptomyces spiramyceticus]QBG49791.1 acyl carrier protein [Streptomyces spiramyceticus]